MPQKLDEVLVEKSDLLWRRILDQPAWWKPNSDGTIRPTSASFLQREDKETKVPEKGVSVQLAKLTTLEKASSFVESAGIAQIEVIIPYRLGLNVVYDPIENKENPLENDLAHTLICPQKGEKITKSQARKMAEFAKMVVLPESQRT